MKKNIDIEKIISLAGGAARIAYELGLHQTSISHWKVKGIPQKHWDRLIVLTQKDQRSKPKITVTDLHTANNKARS